MSGGKPFNITLRWDKEQQVYLAEVTDCSGVVGKGTTREEALVAVKDAPRWHAEAATEGRPPCSPLASEREAQRSPK